MFGNSDSYLTINLFLLAFLHISGLIKHVAEDDNQVKDIIKNTNDEVKKGFTITQGKHISLIFWFDDIHSVNYQENLDHIGHVT